MKVKISFKLPTGGYQAGETIIIEEKEISEKKWTNIVQIIERIQDKGGNK